MPSYPRSGASVASVSLVRHAFGAVDNLLELLKKDYISITVKNLHSFLTTRELQVHPNGANFAAHTTLDQFSEV